MPESPPKSVAEALGPRPAVLTSSPAGSSKAPKVAVASLIGTTIEYYDFAV